MDKIIVPIEVAQHVLWHFGDTHLGIQPGRFTEYLMHAMAVADPHNRIRLGLGFEAYAWAFEVERSEFGGLDRIRTAVKLGVLSELTEVEL